MTDHYMPQEALPPVPVSVPESLPHPSHEPPSALTVQAEVTLAEARRHYWDTIDDQMTTCPVCERTTKRYPRILSAGMLCGFMMLLRLTRELTTPENPEGWINLKTEVTDGLPVQSVEVINAFTKLEVQKLRHWGLIECRPGTDGEGHKSGIWRITQAGFDFAASRISVPLYCYEYDGEAHGMSEERTEISNVWPRFDFAEIMAAPHHPRREDVPRVPRTNRSPRMSGVGARHAQPSIPISPPTPGRCRCEGPLSPGELTCDLCQVLDGVLAPSTRT